MTKGGVTNTKEELSLKETGNLTNPLCGGSAVFRLPPPHPGVILAGKGEGMGKSSQEVIKSFAFIFALQNPG